MTSSSPSSSPPISLSPGDVDAIADLSGEVCPFTFVRAKLALEALPMGGTLRVIVDDEAASRNVPRSAAAWGQEVLGVHALADRPDRPAWAIDLRRRVR